MSDRGKHYEVKHYELKQHGEGLCETLGKRP